MNFLRLCILIVALLAPTSALFARRINVVPYQELFDSSVVVLIATPTETSDTTERIDNFLKVSDLSVVGVETKFRVDAVLKGDQKLKTFTLHHYRLAPETLASSLLRNFLGSLVSFSPQSKDAFLLFLVREGDGRYAPFDQVDPGLQSVQRLKLQAVSPAQEAPKHIDVRPLVAKEQQDRAVTAALQDQVTALERAAFLLSQEPTDQDALVTVCSMLATSKRQLDLAKAAYDGSQTVIIPPALPNSHP